MASAPSRTSSASSFSAPTSSSSAFQQQAIRIACRVRPFLPDELSVMLSPPDEDDIVCSGTSISVLHKAAKHKYRFSSVHGPDSTQRDVFAADVAPMLDSVYQGISSTICSYGMTGSGKTHTMQGDPRSANAMGIIPRVVKALFLKRARMKKVAIEISVEYMEIYKDECFDLLTPKTGKPVKLDVRTNDKGLNIVAGLTRTEISTPQGFEEMFNKASAHRRTEKTFMNAKSSRSHAVLSIHVRTQETKEGGKIWTGKINLLDLAGSENNKFTGNDRERLAESSAINKSLTTLGNVIDALNKGQQRVPYRDSKLTRILQDTLGGNSVGLLICGLTPDPRFRQDTINTLNFAIRTKEVENRVTPDERENKPPPSKPHFAALSRPAPLSAPPTRDPVPAASLKPTVAAVKKPSPPPSTKTRTFGTDIKNVVRENRPRTVSAKGGVVIGRSGAKAGEEKPSVKGKEKQVDDVDFEALVKAKVAEELERQMVEFKKSLQATANDSLVAPKDDVLDARLEYLEKTVKAQIERTTAEDMLDHARKHHDRAFHYNDRAQLEMALDFYQQALTYLPGKKTIMTRIRDIHQALTLSLPVPPRKGTSKPDPSLSPPDDGPVASSSRPPTSLSTNHRVDLDPVVRAATLPRSFKSVPIKKPKSTLNIFADPAIVKPTDVDALDIIELPTPPSQQIVPQPKARKSRRAAPKPAYEEDEADIEMETAVEVFPSATTKKRATRATKKSVYREESDENDLGGLSDADGEWVPT